MKRNDPLLLPICPKCGKYKGVGPCSNSNCSDSEHSRKSLNTPLKRNVDAQEACSLCEKESILSCCRCNRGYCETHGTSKEMNHLAKLDQRVGTCSICKQVVCENCWILEGNGAITCLIHHENSHSHS